MRYGVIGCDKVFQKRHFPSLKGHPALGSRCSAIQQEDAKVSQETGVASSGMRRCAAPRRSNVLLCLDPHQRTITLWVTTFSSMSRSREAAVLPLSAEPRFRFIMLFTVST